MARSEASHFNHYVLERYKRAVHKFGTKTHIEAGRFNSKPDEQLLVMVSFRERMFSVKDFVEGFLLIVYTIAAIHYVIEGYAWCFSRAPVIAAGQEAHTPAADPTTNGALPALQVATHASPVPGARP